MEPPRPNISECVALLDEAWVAAGGALDLVLFWGACLAIVSALLLFVAAVLVRPDKVDELDNDAEQD